MESSRPAWSIDYCLKKQRKTETETKSNHERDQLRYAHCFFVYSNTSPWIPNKSEQTPLLRHLKCLQGIETPFTYNFILSESIKLIIQAHSFGELPLHSFSLLGVKRSPMPGTGRAHSLMSLQGSLGARTRHAPRLWQFSMMQPIFSQQLRQPQVWTSLNPIITILSISCHF